MADTSAVAVLGTGIMGYPMADRLLDHGWEVRVWNRTASKAQPLGDRGATVASTPADAVAGVHAVVTMLADATAVQQAMEGSDGALAAMGRSSLWLQTSTVGIEGHQRLQELARASGVPFVDAPVLGTKKPAEQGQLVVLASGPEEAQQLCRRVFAPLSSRVLWLGPAGQGTRLKLATNAWVLALVEATAESVALADTLGVDPQHFLDAIRGSGVDSPYAHIKGAAMIHGEFPASFPVRLAVKDARLVLDATGGNVDLAGIRAVLTHMERTERLGHGDADMAAVYQACRTARD